MRTLINFAASIATLALLTACTKERLEPMTAVPEARTQINAATKPLLYAVDKHAQNDRIITGATIVDRNTARVAGSHVHDITLAPLTDRTTASAVSSHVHDITFLDGDRTNGKGTGLATAQEAQNAGVCWYCWQTGLAAYPEQMPVRLLESDDPVDPAPRVHISGEFFPPHANTPTTVIGQVGREVPDDETLIGHTTTVKGEVVGVSISDDFSKDE
jgi:hypothetical protein